MIYRRGMKGFNFGVLVISNPFHDILALLRAKEKMEIIETRQCLSNSSLRDTVLSRVLEGCFYGTRKMGVEEVGIICFWNYAQFCRFGKSFSNLVIMLKKSIKEEKQGSFLFVCQGPNTS